MNNKQGASSKNGLSEAGAVDDFKSINGIGPTIEQRLHQAGIHTFAQLAAKSADDIVALIGDLVGMSVERIERQDWLGQAREKAPNVADDNPAEAGTPAADRQHNETFTMSLLLDENNQVRRTRVVHVQDGDESTWAGWQETRLSQFIVEHAGLRLPAEGAARFSGQPGLQELAIVQADDDTLQNFVRQSQPFKVRLVLDLKGVSRPDGAELSCTAIIYAKNLGDNAYQIVGEALKTVPAAESVTLTVAGRSVPIGLYRLEALVILNLLPDGPELKARLTGGDLFQVY